MLLARLRANDDDEKGEDDKKIWTAVHNTGWNFTAGSISKEQRWVPYPVRPRVVRLRADSPMGPIFCSMRYVHGAYRQGGRWARDVSPNLEEKHVHLSLFNPFSPTLFLIVAKWVYQIKKRGLDQYGPEHVEV